MNVGDLWETAVLRDILGYIFPGIVTLLAVCLAAGAVLQVLGGPLWCTVIAELWTTFGWLFAAGVFALGYVVGHIQVALLGLVEELTRQKKTWWSRENMVVRALETHGLATEYRTAALRYFGPGVPGGEEPTWQLWRWCDYYILHVDPHTHKTYMGRYNVLYVLFANLFISTFFLFIGIQLALELQRYLPAGERWCLQSVRGLAALSVLIVWVLPMLVHRAHHSRLDFMIRVFPIFYVLTQEKRVLARLGEEAGLERMARRLRRQRKIPPRLLRKGRAGTMRRRTG